VLRAVTEDYLRRAGVDIELDHGVDNLAMAMSAPHDDPVEIISQLADHGVSFSSLTSRPMLYSRPPTPVGREVSCSSTPGLSTIACARKTAGQT
jgi:hypothetical protein